MSEKYIKQILKRLKCSKSRRMEIKKQLEADIAEQAEHGRTEAEIQKEMGTPAEVAAEFNEGFSEQERKKYKKERWIKRLSVCGVVVICLGSLLYWIFPKQSSIEESKVFEKEEVLQDAKEIIVLFGEEDYEALRARSVAKLEGSMTAEVLEPVKEMLGKDWGDFQSFGNSYIAEICQMGKSMAVVQMNVAYEHASITYTLSFDEDGRLAGFYVK